LEYLWFQPNYKIINSSSVAIGLVLRIGTDTNRVSCPHLKRTQGGRGEGEPTVLDWSLAGAPDLRRFEVFQTIDGRIAAQNLMRYFWHQFCLFLI